MDATARHLLTHLPYLRRYARALTGKAGPGDDLVATALDQILSDPAPYRLEEGERTILYGLLNRLFDATGGRPDMTGALHPIETALAALPEVERRAYLLIRLEVLSPERVAPLLGLDVASVQRHLARAEEGLREAMVANILIVEDDAIIAFDLAETVRGMGHRVAGTTSTMGAALETARLTRPTLALMDLRLAHGDSGIATAQALWRQSDVPVIFVTAFGDELTRRGLEGLGPVIRKPFTREEIERAITQAVFAPQAVRPARLAAWMPPE